MPISSVRSLMVILSNGFFNKNLFRDYSKASLVKFDMS